MKRIILLFALFYSLTFGQGWNNTVTTSISESNLDKMDVFTNKDGNHLLIKRTNGNIVYYNFNSSGTVDGNKTATLESNGDFPNIVGSNDKIFALYKAGNYIKGKYSTNGGSSWSSLPYNISTSTNACNGVDAVYDKDRGIHLVFAMRDTYMYFETYYYRLNSSNQWVDSKNVTDYGSEVGGVPSVTFSDNRIHVSYNTGEADPPYIGVGESKTRDKNLSTSTWLTPQLVSDGEVDYGTSREKLRVRGNKLFCIFLDCWADLGQYGYHVQVKTRDLTGTYWPGSYTQIFYDGSPQLFLGAETTANSNLNVVNIAWDGLKHIYYDGSDWSDEYTITTDVLNYENQHLAFAVTSNDLFVLWKPLSGNYVKYRQYDAAPLTPANFSGTTYNNHPKITWTLNNEPDITGYEVYRNITGSYVLLGTVSASTSYFVDDEVGLGGSVEGMVFLQSFLLMES